jgi:hypothetical protein
MAHFYGTIKGNRGTANRCGTPASGLRVQAASYQGCVDVTLYKEKDADMALVRLLPWHGSGSTQTLYAGPIGGKPKSDT